MPWHNDLISRRSFILGACSAVGMAFSADADPALMTLAAASERVRRKSISPVDLTQACLRRIDALNPVLNAYITVTRDAALEQARRLEAEARRGRWRGPLHGIPVSLKDNIDTAGVRTTAASELFKDRIPSVDAEVVRRLKNAGAVILGKANLHEFALGGTAAVSYFGPVHNPWALDRITGGSSGGSAAAVATGLCFASLGTDTAGSIRTPASYCGVVGLKPTYGRVSNRGTIPDAWTLDHVGPLCRTVEDAALMLDAIAGFDRSDPSSEDLPVPHFARASRGSVSKLRVGVPRVPYFEALDAEVERAVTDAIDVLGHVAGEVRDLESPIVDAPLLEIWTKIVGAETYTYHARWLAESPEKYQPVTRQRLMAPKSAGVQGQTSTELPASAYAAARRELELLRRDIQTLFSAVDVLALPTMPAPPVAIADAADPSIVNIRNTAPFNVLGLPALTVPCGFTGSGLPIGLQLVGAPFSEVTVLALGHAYERATSWHRRMPPL